MRIYQLVTLTPHQNIRLDERGSHHVAHVLRAKVGEMITLFNGKGGEYQASITQINKKGVEVKLISFNKREIESPLPLHLAQGMMRGEKMDFIVQKTTELGVKKIHPLITTRSQGRLHPGQKEKCLTHFQSVAMSACEQCGRNQLPEIAPIETFDEWLDQIENNRYLLLLTPQAENKLSSIQFPLEVLQSTDPIVVLIGPEGGLTETEKRKALAKGFKPFHLGPRILRAETAACSALIILQSKYGDL